MWAGGSYFFFQEKKVTMIKLEQKVKNKTTSSLRKNINELPKNEIPAFAGMTCKSLSKCNDLKFQEPESADVSTI